MRQKRKVPGTLTPDARQEKQPFFGRHQAGILTPQQASMMLVAFDVLAADKADLERLFRLLTQRIAFLTQGGPAAGHAESAAAADGFRHPGAVDCAR